MEKMIDQKLMDSLKIAEDKFGKNDMLIQQFEKAKNDFETLIKKGYIKKRGNNLLSISDKVGNKAVFNRAAK